MKSQILVNLKINAKLQPFLRHDIEDNIEKLINEYQIPCEINGGGTYQNEDGTIDSCDINFICLKEDLDQVIQFLKSLPNPKGSEISYYENEAVENSEPMQIAIGDLECLCYRFNGQDLPKEVYQDNNINDVIDTMMEVLTGYFVFYSYEELEHTYFYFYGKSYQQMKDLLKDFDKKFALCQQCLIEQIV
ncbi:hypothetical protein QV06_10020 [Gallibacterium genomosp. 3]|uniref:Uncharacterized protein n=1 Tax=Gallibacterium genomosp. 3 TaxID=505345 RepID=A0A1A7PM65_9PAST|nr:hypothetical protein [Gallibacterium genomosp. 3]OBX03179.1 hypothetical protein QV06_10020 [Gallibacterium genomosp. 3]